MTGLTNAEAARRLAEHGTNTLAPPRPLRFVDILAEELTEPMILLLLAVAAAYFVFDKTGEALVVLGIILGIVLLEVWTEFRAKRAVRALGELTAPTTLALRSGHERSVPVTAVVVGDVVVLREGSRVPADAVLLRADDLAIDEAPLTGESLPVDKMADRVIAVNRDANYVFRGTTVTRGEALAEVTATGPRTRLGAIAGLAREAKPPKTPLQRALRELARPLLLVALAFATLIPTLEVLLRQAPWQDALLTGLSLAFAAIPEELPILVPVVLGLGALRLARANALARGLRPAETLAHVTAVVSDKTGTLTENRLRLTHLVPRNGDASRHAERETELRQAAHLSLGLQPNDGTLISDPIERAIADALQGEASTAMTLVKRVPFSRQRGWSGAAWRDSQRSVLYLKGAPETVVQRDPSLSDDQRRQALDQAARLASDGQRTLAVASAAIPDHHEPDPWRYLGLIALADPLRADAPEAVHDVQHAGIQLHLATGDHPNIARAIARQVGLTTQHIITGAELGGLSDQDLQNALGQGAIFARITPAHKLRLITALQTQGHVVAMTGDGINDAPALKAADIGIAMGLHGTDAAREAANLILTDDRLATLATALRHARALRANLRKAVRYYLAVKTALVLTMLVPILAGLGPPLTPAMIVLLELFMDLAASTAFITEPADTDPMRQPPPQRGTPILDPTMLRGILMGGALLSATVLASAYLATLIAGTSAYHSAAFTGWMLGHVALAFSYRTWTRPLPASAAFTNPILNLWALAAVATAVIVTALPWPRHTLGTQPLPIAAWLATTALATTLWFIAGRIARGPAKFSSGRRGSRPAGTLER